MASADASKDTPALPQPPPPPEAPPQREPFFQAVRRLSDHHISSLLHSLIGLPSMITPPSGSDWINDDKNGGTGVAQSSGSSDDGCKSDKRERVFEIAPPLGSSYAASDTELDYYRFFERQFRQENGGKKRTEVVE